MEFYQMPMFNKILVKNIEKAEKWYEKTLGFKSVFKFRNDKNEVLMNHLRLEKYQDLTCRMVGLIAHAISTFVCKFS